MTIPEATPGAKEKVFDRQLVRVASVTIAGSFMTVVDTTIVNVALNTLARSFHTTFATIQWVSTSYLLALATVLPVTRWFFDRFGARRSWMVSSTLFLAGSLLCGMAWSAPSLICFRVLQGIGGGMMAPISQTILVRQSGPERLGRVMSIVGIPSFLAPVVGPVIGGVLISVVSWRFIFFVNIPIGIYALARAYRVLEPGDTAGAKHFDLTGLLLLSPGLPLLIYAISEFGNAGRLNSRVIIGGCIGLSLTVAFVVHALRTETPLLDLRLLKNRGMAVATSVLFLFGSGLFGAIFLVPLYYQVARGQSPLRAAVLMITGGVGGMVGMPIAGRIMDRYGARRIVPFGLLLLVVSLLPYTQLSPSTNEAYLSFFWFLRGVATGSVGTPATAAAYITLTREQISAATTINTIAQSVGASFGVALVAVVFQRRIVGFLPRGNISTLANLSPKTRSELAVPLAHAFGFTFWVTVAVVLIGLVASLWLPRRRPSPETM